MQRLRHPSDYVRKPWKNGGGELLDIAAEPPDAGLNAFDWRASIALVQRSGPFSHFPGIDRTIVLLEGVGMRLDSATWSAHMAVANEPVPFPGELAITCTLIDGPTRVFNLKVRRGVVRGDLMVVRDTAVTLSTADTILCYVASGAVESVAGTALPQRIDTDCTWICTRDSGGAPDVVQVRPLTDDAIALVAAINRVPS